ncbi:MAG: hypothetical protein V2I57_12420 [Xanthomonadales bacterium]|jgi:hypothetical protein|nr:hypothetical protein [Xanthomonadales bacterium]
MDASGKRISRTTLTRRFTAICVVAAVCLAPSAWAVDTYRWVDPETGKYDYSPTPPEDPDQPYVLMRDGRIIERYVGSERLEKPESEFDAERAAAEAQAKADALLMVQFKQFDDIDEAMEVELDNLRYDYNLLDGTYASLEKSLFEQIEVAANRQRAGLTVANHELEKIESLRGRMSANRVAREELSVRESRIRDEYDLKRDRYRELLQAQPRG